MVYVSVCHILRYGREAVLRIHTRVHSLFQLRADGSLSEPMSRATADTCSTGAAVCLPSC
jgi:hypothetical protein